MPEDATEGAYRQFLVKGHYAANVALGRFLSEDDVASALSRLHETTALQRPDGLPAGYSPEFRHA